MSIRRDTIAASCPEGLRAEHRDDSLGIGVAAPRLSWRLPFGAREQLSYELRRDDVQPTVSVDSDEHVLVPWPWAPLGSGEACAVSARVRTEAGWTDWSSPLAVEAGLLRASDWTATWVTPTAESDTPPRPAFRLRGDFVLDRPVRLARLYVTAHGLVEPFLDGTRVGRDELLPGFTEYAHHTQVTTYDVTAVLRSREEGAGPHTLGAILADGWYRGQVGILRAADQWGDTTALLAQLAVVHDDDSTTVVGTDGSWTWAPSHILFADLIEGQREDRRLLEPGWATPGFDASAWSAVDVVHRGHDFLVVSPAPPVRAVQELRPVAVTTPGPGIHVVDLGQNINGRVRLGELGPAGTDVQLTHGEALDGSGDVSMRHLQPAMPFLDEPLSAGQVDSVVSAGPGDSFEPTLTTHGFRYVRVAGHPGPLDVGDVTGVVVHTDLPERGGFACSDGRLNRLHDAAVWSFRDNACDIPTDCPTRERAGWTGDWQLYIPTATFLYDVAGFSLKWLRDLGREQWADGTLGNMAPMPKAERTGMLERMNGSAGWGDAIVLVPWEMHQEYGDADVLAEMWPAMVAWLDRTERIASTARHPDRVARDPEPRPHERFLWDTGFHWGEWLEPGGEPSDFPSFVAADKAEVATAFYAWSTRHAARVAALLGREDQAARYAELSERVVDAWRKEFVRGGLVVPHTQANLVRALRFGLVPDELRQRAADDLAVLVDEAGTHLGTGFLSTPDLLPVLADHGHLDTAYGLLLQDTPPSWMAMIARGATTVWERWEGIDESGEPHESLNHYSKGAVISFLHRYVAGLQRLEPTWRRFRVQPRPGAGLTWAEAHHTSPHGGHRVRWTLEGDRLILDVDVPATTAAEVVLPDGSTHDLLPGHHTLTC